MDPSNSKGSPSQPQPESQPTSHKDKINNTDDNHHRVRFAEGIPEPSQKKIHQPVPRRVRPSPAATTPAVYWDDRENDANLEQYTFYREGTPTPPEDRTHEKALGHGGLPAPVAESSAAGEGVAGSDRDFSIGPLGNGESRNWSLAGSSDLAPTTKKRVFWVIVVSGVLLLIGIAVGVGVGLGVGLSRRQSGQPAEDPSRRLMQSSSSLPASVVNGSPTPTSPTSTLTSGIAPPETSSGMGAASRPDYNSDCPALNNTIYHVPGSTRSFLRLCGIDYSGDSGATDMAHLYTSSMAECMNVCASNAHCEACAWGYLPGDQGTEHRCYMKRDLQRAHRASSDWCFAILQ
ncbi:hypothetical protein MFIFM68171_01730 [Madurella fahalii]|uniref:Apple domain-containing protein n=1 Tax=Madurella fahalii TaxID=1157608 RepID=A0ABQ0G1T5_9PEZI